MTEELKKLLENTKSEEEKKAILEAHKMELTAEELENVDGGHMHPHGPM